MHRTLRLVITLIALWPDCIEFLWATPVQRPTLLKHIETGETSWYCSPAIYDLDGDGTKELVGTFYSVFVWDSAGNLLDKMATNHYHYGRIYAPAAVADLDGDGITEIVVGGSNGKVAAYEWRDRHMRIKPGWPALTYHGDATKPEIRSLAAADLNNDGPLEIVTSNTQTDSDQSQVYVFASDGQLFQPPDLTWHAWPRYNRQNGTGNDADSNGQGNHGYGCYGENIGVGNLNEDSQLEIVVTFDNHQINVFRPDGVSFLASDYFRNRATEYSGNRMNWGQFIRWFDAGVEDNHYHLHQGPWPDPTTNKWMQWTASPPNVIDLNGDGQNEVVAIANVERDEGSGYVTKHFSVMVLEGGYGDGSRSARRLANWEELPGSGAPQDRSGLTWYPPEGIPAPTTVDINGDGRPEIIAPMNDGFIYAFSANAQRLWRYDYTHGRSLIYASEVTVADLNQDQEPELVFTTYGLPDSYAPGVPQGYLVILDARGQMLYDIKLPNQGTNGNGKGAPAAPTIGDLNGDGALEIIVQTFDGDLFIYTVPGSATNQLLWPTARGSYLRQGRIFTGSTLTPIPTPPSTTERPTVSAFRVRGKAGSRLRLRYGVHDSSGYSKDTITVNLKHRRVFRKLTKMEPIPGTGKKSVRWNTTGNKGGNYTFCARAANPAGSRSVRACAKVRLLS